MSKQLRHVFTCLKIEDLSKENTRLSDALRTAHERQQAKCRSRVRAASKRCRFKVPRGHVVHHVDHNACNNTCSNLRPMSDLAHRRLHRTRQTRMCRNLCDDVYTILRKYYL